MVSTQRLDEIERLQREGDHECTTGFTVTRGEIECQKVFMKYRLNLPYTLKDLSFKIEGGSRVGIVGRTGAGKSSIMHLLFRLNEPSSGTILIDNQDYLDAGLNELRLQMSVIPQNPFILKASVRENLDPFSQHSDEAIYEALGQVRLLDLIEGLENTLDTPITAEALSLSAGQRQLICLARAILRNSKIVMLDEATANMDNETDKFIQEQVRAKFQDSTVIMIAHRLRTLIDCDQIIVLGEGTCKEIGHPADLASDEDSEFRNMIEHSGAEERAFLMRQLRRNFIN